VDPGHLLFVLHRPSSAENIGAAARAMKNFGLSRLCIVESGAWSGPGRLDRSVSGREDALARAGRMARHATDLLESAALEPDLRSALASATWTCGTTSRALPGRPAFSPRDLATELVRRGEAGPVAVVFGEERRGLSDRELDLCQAVCTIPTSQAYESMNLAQAVAILAYEVSLASRETQGAPSPAAQVDSGPGEPARHATLEALWDRLTRVLLRVGYLNSQNPEQILAEWRRLLARADPTQREVELLVAAARALERALRVGEG
jgi:tRNA/rRNA methyltransferase